MSLQEFSGERVTQGVLNPTPEDLWRIWSTLHVNPLGTLLIRSQHLDRYEFAACLTPIPNDNKKLNFLDIGCGVGYGLNYLSNRNGDVNVYGIDIDSASVQEAKKCFGGGRRGFVNARAQALPFESESFSMATCFETIEHVADPNKLLSEASRVLKPGGVMLVSTPNRDISNPGTSISDKPRNKFHEFELTPEEFKCLLTSHFRCVKVYGQEFHPDKMNIIYRGLYRMGTFGHYLANTSRVLRSIQKSEVKPLRSGTIPGYLVAICTK